MQESYVNLIPTAQRGTHVNGLRTGFTDALREFCDFRNLLPRGDQAGAGRRVGPRRFVLSLKMTDPQFSGQTKERLSSRQAAGFVEGAAHDAFSLWLNQHVEMGEKIAQLAIERATRAAEDRKADRPQEDHAGPGPARQARRLHLAGPVAHRTVPGRRRFGRRQRATGARQGFPGDPAAARQDPQHLGSRIGQRAGLDRSARPRGGDRLRSGQGRHHRPALRQGHHPRRRRFRRPAHRHVAGGAVPASISRRWCAPATSSWRCRRCSASTSASRCSTALDEEEKRLLLERIEREKMQGRGQRHPLQGPGRDEPAAAARIDDPSRHAPAGAADRSTTTTARAR